MCRQIAVPAGFSRLRTLEILLSFEDRNTDGTGYGYVKDGEFVVKKWPRSLSNVLKTEDNFLDHLPYDGWTIIHLRAASCGAVLKKNTHPFIINNESLVCHNGAFSSSEIVKLALGPFRNFEGDTDSEVAGNLMNVIGVEKFAQEVKYGGVYLSLGKDGHLWAIKTSGELSIFSRKNESVVLASEFPPGYKNIVEALHGWYHFGPDGKFIANKQRKESITTFYDGRWTPASQFKSLNDDDDMISKVSNISCYHYK